MSSTLIHLKCAAVFGSGAFGTALSTVLARKSKKVKIWHMNASEAAAFTKNHENRNFLKGFQLPHNIEYSSDVKYVAQEAQIILFAIPTQFTRNFMKQHGETLKQLILAHRIPVLVCSKGIEQGTLKFPTEIISEFIPQYPISVLAGPSFAREIVEGKSTSVCVASAHLQHASLIQRIMSTEDHVFLCLTSTDVVGCEVASAMKNVIAIASGILEGRGMGKNARAALITRSLLEIRDVTHSLGGDGSAVFGLAGIGDLLLTSSSHLSRNFMVGVQLGKGKTYEEIMRGATAVAEGVTTAQSLHQILVTKNVNAPICTEVYKVIYEKQSVHDAMHHFFNPSLSTEGLPVLFPSKL